MGKTLDIGLTGNRFSGKTGVCKLFKQIGAPVFDADVVLKYILNYKLDLNESVRKHFGSEYVLGEWINPLAFDTDEKFLNLINLVEFDLFEAYNRFKKTNKGSTYIIFKSSLIFEKKWNNKFDSIISVFTPKEERIYRLKNKTFKSTSIITEMLKNECDDIVKNQMSDWVIHNYNEAPDIFRQVENISSELVDLHIKMKRSYEKS